MSRRGTPLDRILAKTASYAILGFAGVVIIATAAVVYADNPASHPQPPSSSSRQDEEANISSSASQPDSSPHDSTDPRLWTADQLKAWLIRHTHYANPQSDLDHQSWNDLLALVLARQQQLNK